MTGLPETLPEAFFQRPVADVAKGLLGVRLVSAIGGRRVSGIIVETEAYGGKDDPASHAATVSGITRRNRAMFGPVGRAYVYRSHGVHWCFNVVARARCAAGAVLVRGVHADEGLDVMRERRAGHPLLCAGPGRVAQAFGVDDEVYGHDLRLDPLWLQRGRDVSDAQIETTGRVGVSRACEVPYRFYVRGAEGVSRPSPRTFSQGVQS